MSPDSAGLAQTSVPEALVPFDASFLPGGGGGGVSCLPLRLDRMLAYNLWLLFEPTAGRLQLDINLVNIYIHTDSYVGNEGIYIYVFAL